MGLACIFRETDQNSGGKQKGPDADELAEAQPAMCAGTHKFTDRHRGKEKACDPDDQTQSKREPIPGKPEMEIRHEAKQAPDKEPCNPIHHSVKQQAGSEEQHETDSTGQQA